MLGSAFSLNKVGDRPRTIPQSSEGKLTTPGLAWHYLSTSGNRTKTIYSIDKKKASFVDNLYLTLLMKHYFEKQIFLQVNNYVGEANFNISPLDVTYMYTLQ